MPVIRLLILVVLLGMSATTARADLQEQPDRHPAPELALNDLGDQPQTLQAHAGEVVAVNFWAAWCAPCLLEMPSLQRLAAKLAQRRFTVLAVNVGDGKARIWSFLKKPGRNFQVLMDPEGEAARAWKVDYYPSTFLIDPQGRVRYVAYGIVDWEDPAVAAIIESLLKPPVGHP